MGEANQRGNFEQRKQQSMENSESKSPEQQRIELNDAGKMLSDVVNNLIMKHRIPIPFIVATFELIKHDLCNQHIAMTDQMHQIAKGNIPVTDVESKQSEN